MRFNQSRLLSYFEVAFGHALRGGYERPGATGGRGNCALRYLRRERVLLHEGRADKVHGQCVSQFPRETEGQVHRRRYRRGPSLARRDPRRVLAADQILRSATRRVSVSKSAEFLAIRHLAAPLADILRLPEAGRDMAGERGLRDSFPVAGLLAERPSEFPRRAGLVGRFFYAYRSLYARRLRQVASGFPFRFQSHKRRSVLRSNKIAGILRQNATQNSVRQKLLHVPDMLRGAHGPGVYRVEELRTRLLRELYAGAHTH